MKQVYDRRLAADRRSFLSDIRMVAKKPKGTRVQIVPGDIAKPGDDKAVLRETR